MAREQVNVGFPEHTIELLKQATGAGNAAGAVRELLKRGLWNLMTEHGKPVSKFWLGTTAATFDGALETYQQFTDAVATEAGLVGPKGNRYRFEPAPNRHGRPWEYVILSNCEELRDGAI